MAVVHHVDQVLAVGGDEGPVEGGKTHGLGLLVAHAVGHVQAHHVSRVWLVERHQVELKIHNNKSMKKKQTTFIAPTVEKFEYLQQQKTVWCKKKCKRVIYKCFVYLLLHILASFEIEEP